MTAHTTPKHPLTTTVVAQVCYQAAGLLGLTALEVRGDDQQVWFRLSKGARHAECRVHLTEIRRFRGNWRHLVDDKIEATWKPVDDGVPDDPGC